jgi:hypothetical protein
MSRLPNLFLVGAPKAGTTSLYHYLDQHPEIYMSAIKEPHYFAEEIRPENCDAEVRRRLERENRGLAAFLGGPMQPKRFSGIVTQWEDYLRLFQNATGEPVLGEASVCYLWSPTAAQRIAARIPHAKILVMLRDPADRAFSQYLHGLGNGVIRWSLREHIERNLADRSGQISVHSPFLEFGLYAGQLRRYLDRFGSNVWVGLHEDFKSRPREVLRDIFRFLGVDPEFSPDLRRRDLEAQVPRWDLAGWLKRTGWWQAAANLTPSRLRPLIRRALIRPPGSTNMHPEDRRFLIHYYREDILSLTDLLGRDLGAWLQAD